MTDATALGPLGQVSLLTRSAAAAEAWYRDVLGLEHLYTFGPLVFFRCGDTRLFVREVPDAEWRAGSILYFDVPDVHAAARALVARGVDLRVEPALVHRHVDTGVEEWMAFFDDPDGNTLAVMARVRPV